MAYDAIIVGARVAGSATAIFLAKAGYKVLLVDKDTFPSFTLSSHFFWAKAHALFAELGVLEELERTSATPLLWHVSESEVRTVVAEFPPVDGQRAARCLRRIVLDKILIDAARKDPNIEVREKFTVRELVKENGRVVGIRGRSPNSHDVAEEAKMVIGADGRNSFMLKSLKPARYLFDASQRANYFAYFRDVPLPDPPMARIVARRKKEFFFLPADSGLTVVAVIFPIQEFEAFKKDHEANFDQALKSDPRIVELLGPGGRESPVYGTGQMAGYFYQPWGPGWALVGDSCHYIDAEPAQGITNALLMARLLARALEKTWRGEVPEELALWEYQRQRDLALKDMHALLYRPDEIMPPRGVRRAFSEAIAKDPELGQKWLGIYNGGVPVAEFYSPQNVAQALARRQ